MKRIILLLMAVCCLSCDPEKAIDAREPKSSNWWKHRVFYEVFVRSFYDSNADGIGDLKGVIDKLDYLNDGDPGTDSDLGITGILLMPIHPSPSYHGYDVVDYMSINLQYGTLSDFKELLRKAHDRDIKVIIDFMPNETSDRHPWFANSTNTRSDKRQYYIWTTSAGTSGWSFRSGAYYYSTHSAAMPDLNLRNERVTTEILNVASFWDKSVGVDGYRMNSIPYLVEENGVPHSTARTMEWLDDFWMTQKLRNPSLMLVGEVGLNTADIVPYTEKRTDYSLESDLADVILDAVASGNVSSLSQKMNEVTSLYPERQYGVFLADNNQNRVVERLALDINKAKLAAAIMLTLPGVPYLYYGEEVGMRGANIDENIRRPMQWSSATNAGFSQGVPWHPMNDDYLTANVNQLQKDPNSIWHHYRKLINLRNHSLPLTQGFYFPIESSSSQIFSYLLVNGNDGVLVVHNLSGSALTTAMSSTTTRLEPGTYKAIDMMDGSQLGNITVASGGRWDDVSLGISFEGLSTRIIHLVGD
jgi:alpha-amylase